MTVLVCEPIVHAVAYCQSKAFFKQSSEALIQGLLPGEEEESGSSEIDETFTDVVNKQESDSNCSGSEDFLNEEEDKDSQSEFDSEEFDHIKDHCHDSETCCEHDHEHEHEHGHEHEHDLEHEYEHEIEIFNYSLLGKFIFEFGAREDVLVRNRRFLFELSQIIEEVASDIQTSCCHKEILSDSHVN